MKSNLGRVFPDLKDICSKEEAIAMSIGGLLIGFKVTNGEIIFAMPGLIMNAIEMAIGYSINLSVDSNTRTLMVAGLSHNAILVNQKNRENMGVRKERSRWEIVEDILTVLVEEKKPKKTRIMQRAYLDWRNFQRYFDFLLEESFISKSKDPEEGCYELSEKGRELLKRLKDVKEILH
ncbi:MAG: hypothetical protein OIN88_15270 [Candidatus Methanoperedens sp.]|nr:hypothetical protein [Candidatus Methanoperedens sp.]HLB71043.1 winged helix-turn-helix domain-containing protein [Candidatus Methanoperedens sp.]